MLLLTQAPPLQTHHTQKSAILTTFPKPHHSLLCTITLASLVKGRWIDGKAQALILLLSACDMPTIFMLQTFCRQDGGIASPPPFAPHQPFQNRTIPCFTPSPLPLNERFVGFASMQSLWAFNFGHPCPPSKKVRQE